jgi:GNAT superfamily N-acetyltransferase
MSDKTIETIVTYLVLTAPPKVLPPMPVGARFALMKVENIPLHYYRYLYAAVGTSWLWFERLALSDEDLSARIHRAGVEVFVLYANGAPAGYYELDFSDAQETKLVYFGLMPEWTGRRIGPWLLGSAIAEGLSRKAERITVNTCTLDHPAALPLYQRLGFKPVAREERRLTIPPHLAIPGHIAAPITP